MKNLLQRTTGDLYLAVHNSDQRRAARIKRLALKHRYSTYKNEVQEIEILIDLYEKLAAVSEERTGQAVDNCRLAVTSVVERFFAAREARAAQAATDIIKGMPLNDVLLAQLISVQDLKELAEIARGKIASELRNRFGVSAICPVLRLELDEFHSALDLINEWQNQKRKSAIISKQAAKWSNKAWNIAIEGIVNNPLAADMACQADIGELLLNVLGVDPAREESELTNGLVRRILGLLTDVKMRIIHQLNLQTAEIIYQMHDFLIGRRLEEKIALLEEKLSHCTVTVNERA